MCVVRCIMCDEWFAVCCAWLRGAETVAVAMDVGEAAATTLVVEHLGEVLVMMGDGAFSAPQKNGFLFFFKTRVRCGMACGVLWRGSIWLSLWRMRRASRRWSRRRSREWGRKRWKGSMEWLHLLWQ